ncbi:MAG: penicillin-binding protein 2, partial [Gammaproteobacteria bacterium]|nr:penicillin-binding protein 2 [Gammaproteobacteria bacterium]
MPPSSAIADAAREARLFGHRALVAAACVVVLALLLLGRMLQLQAIEYEHFKTLSDDNRVKVLPIPPTRGRIFDRNGVVLAENIATFSLEIVPEAARAVPDLIAGIRKLVDVSEADEARFLKLKNQSPKFAHVPLKLNLTEEEVARISVNRHLLPGVEVNARLTRRYPQGHAGSHLVGYVGRINEAELKVLDVANYRGTSHVGKTGVERAYESTLHGQVGYEHVETNAEGRVLRVLERHDPVP